ncbi:MAG: glycosyltransferase family 2 protein [Spirochaetales bacterium]|nr:glycosyltransferase family 2 protein [Spirochaetales bacterium]
MKHLLVIPVFNEEKTLPTILRSLQSLRQEQKSFDFLCINDGSTDATRELLHAIPSIHHDRNRGYGYTIREALSVGRREGYDFVTTMDCDHQHDPADLIRFFDADPTVDVVSGSRYLPASRQIGMAPVDRMQINRRIVARIQDRLGLPLTDAFCGFKRYATMRIDSDEFREDGYSFPLEFWVYAVNKKLSIQELPVDRIYTDAYRSFGLNLDLQRKRYRYYLETLRRAEERFPEKGRTLCRSH